MLKLIVFNFVFGMIPCCVVLLKDIRTLERSVAAEKLKLFVLNTPA